MAAHGFEAAQDGEVVAAQARLAAAAPIVELGASRETASAARRPDPRGVASSRRATSDSVDDCSGEKPPSGKNGT